MTVAQVLDGITDGEWARHPTSLAIEAYFDGWSQASGGPARYFPRLLTDDEHECWRDGWLEAKDEGATPGDWLLARPQCTPPPACRGCPLLEAIA